MARGRSQLHQSLRLQVMVVIQETALPCKSVLRGYRQLAGRFRLRHIGRSIVVRRIVHTFRR